MDLDRMLERIQDRQWALADFDWDAPGADQITDEQYEGLKGFMTDLVWIEQIGARGFAGLAMAADDPTLATIYRYFHAEEQRHANAELALMHRWGMLEDGKVPEPNINVRLAMDWLDANADKLPLASLGTIIPMLEVALDGALVKFLLDEVADPLCHEVFDKINSDESRHLAVDFHVLELLGEREQPKSKAQILRWSLKPNIVVGSIIALPLFGRIGRNVKALGLDETRLLDSLKRFAAVGERSPNVRKNPAYRAIAAQVEATVTAGPSPSRERLTDLLIRASDHYPKRPWSQGVIATPGRVLLMVSSIRGFVEVGR